MAVTGVVRLLIVEDQSITRIGLRVGLQAYERIEIVGETGDGLEAIELANDLKPDVILLGLRLPGCDGIEVCSRVKKSLPEIRVIMFTSQNATEEAIAAFSSGADGYCLKDTSTEQVSRAVLAVYEGAVWLDAKLGTRLLVPPGFDRSRDSADSQAASDNDRQYGLSQREMEVLRMAVDGFSNLDIGQRLCISEDTVKSHMRRILQKLAVSDRTQAAVKAVRENLL